MSSKSKPMSVVGYDITLNNPDFSWKVWGKKLNGWCKKWVFQLEKGESGTPHFQARIHLIQKKTMAGLLTDFKQGNGPINEIGGRWSVTSGAVHAGNKFNYVQKSDRVAGPWRDTDWVEPPVLTRQLRTFLSHTQYDWQKTVEDWTTQVDDRSIKVIYDTWGNAGKSVFSEYLEYIGRAFELPPMRAMEDIMQFCFSFPAQKVYLIDMPRGMKKDKLGEFYAGLECLKNGVCYDKRYAGKKRRFDRPQIIVFTNCIPKLELMTKDRWEIFSMGQDHALSDITAECHEESLNPPGRKRETLGGLSGATL